MSETPVVLQVSGLRRAFSRPAGLLRGRESMLAVDAVSLTLREGETLGIVGESGCGKSTLARLLVGLDRADEGSIELLGRPVQGANRRELARRIQYVFQDPLGSLNPRKTVAQTLEAPLRHLLGMSSRAGRRERVAELMQAVGLLPGQAGRYPHEFSGGQAQRIGIARALAASARVLVLDEPVSALDVSIQAQILTLLAGLRERFALSYLFISHDLSVVESVSDRVAVMYFGRVVELGPARQLFRQPRHPYTRLLIDSAPGPGMKVDPAVGAELPDPFNPPPGCSFVARCPHADRQCHTRQPSLTDAVDGSGAVACWHPAPPR